MIAIAGGGDHSLALRTDGTIRAWGDNSYRQTDVPSGVINVVAIAAKKGIPVPAFSTALAFYDAYRCERLPANLLQAQRDYFGAHTYERVDRPRGQFFHTNWTGRGGTTASTTYNV